MRARDCDKVIELLLVDEVDAAIDHTRRCPECQEGAEYLIRALTSDRRDWLTCEQCEVLLPEYSQASSEDQGSKARLRRVTLHLDTCPYCAKAYSELCELEEFALGEKGEEPPVYPVPDLALLEDDEPRSESLPGVLARSLKSLTAFTRYLLSGAPRRPAWALAVVVAVTFLVLGSAAVLWLPESRPPLGPPVAEIASVSSTVEVKQAHTNRKILASVGMPLRQGDVVLAYDGAAATIVCDSGLPFSIPESSTLTLDCEDTEALREVAQLYSAIDPMVSISRRSWHGSLDVTLSSAPEDQRQAPLLLSPRNTVITETRPVFQWQHVEGAEGYLLSVTSPSGFRWEKETSDVSMAYPTEEPSLNPGGAYAITLRTRGDDDLTDVTDLLVMDDIGVSDLSKAETSIRTLEADETTRRYLLARLYQEQGMWTAAIDQLKWLVDDQEIVSAYLSQELGDLLMQIELYDDAEGRYRKALDIARTNADREAQAAAHIGLARTTRAFGETKQSLEHLTVAEDLYRQAGEEKWAETATGAQTSPQRPASSSFTWVWAIGATILLAAGSILVWTWKSQEARNGMASRSEAEEHEKMDVD